MTPLRDADRDGGVILLNVLAIVAVASAVVVVMTATQDVGLQRTQRLREAAQASAIAQAGELSAIVALRRDKAAAPQTDHLREAWASVGQQETTVQGGRFSLTISDAQARFNVNDAVGGGLAARDLFNKLLARAGAPAGTAERAAVYVETLGPLPDLSGLAAVGLAPDVLGRLAETVTALPTPTSVNINTADEGLLAVMLANPVSARVLVARRARAGFVTPADVMAAKAVLPSGLGFTSDHYWVRTESLVGDTRQVLTSLVQRRIEGGRPVVAAIARRRGSGGAEDAPPP